MRPGIFGLLILAFGGAPGRASDPAADAQARAALALAKAKQVRAVAAREVPKPVAVLTYAEGMVEAAKSGRVLVVQVGPDAVPVVAPEVILARGEVVGYSPGTVLVLVPTATGFEVKNAISRPSAATLDAAIRAATKGIVPKPKALDWS